MTQQYVSITISPEQRMFAIQGLQRLTAREREVLQDIVNSKTCKEIARLHDIAPRTAEVHKSNIMLKMGVNRTTEIFQILYVLATEATAIMPPTERDKKIKVLQKRLRPYRHTSEESNPRSPL
ncbi:MAG: hypothetical protein GXP11_09840 [Gammaproteobacteria bacterium]|nr:hypothetical protein [Gammaproteobacteria bacterium]